MIAIGEADETPWARETAAAAEQDPVVAEERLRLLMRNAPLAFAASIINGAIVLAVLWPIADQALLVGWAGTIVACVAARAAVWRSYGARPSTRRARARLVAFYGAGAALSGAAWGAAFLVFREAGPGAEALLLFMIAGMTAGAVASSAPYTAVSAAFNGPALAPVAFAFAFGEGATGFAMAAVAVMYFGFTLRLGLNAQQTLTEGIGLKLDNDRLYTSLREQAERSQRRERLFRNLVESSGDLTFVVSYDGQIKYASPAAADLLGRGAAGLSGANLEAFIHADDFAAMKAAAKQTLQAAGASAPVYHTRIKNADGTWTVLSGWLSNMLATPGVEGLVYRAADVAAAAGGPRPASASAITDKLDAEEAAAPAVTLGEVASPAVKASILRLIRAVADREAQRAAE